MSKLTYISGGMLIRDLVRRHPQAIAVLYQHGVDPTYAQMSIELAAKASKRNPETVLAGLCESLDPRS